MHEEISFTIPLPPVTKKNSQRIIFNPRTKAPMVIPSKAYKDYEKACSIYVKPYGIEKPINLKCLYYMPTHRRCDLVNLLEATCDILVKYGCIADDNFHIVAAVDESRVLYDKENPRTEITITSIDRIGADE